MRKTLIATALLLGALTACTTTEPTPKVTVTETTAPVEEGSAGGTNGEPATDDTDTPGLGQRDITEVAMRMTWDGTSETDRDNMCAGVDLFGTEWAAEQLQSGGGTDAELDWQYAAELIQIECDARP